MFKSFKQIVKDFFSPESAELNLGALKLKYTDAMRQDVAQVLAKLREKRVLFAKIDHEIWEYVFSSLKDLRSALSEISGRLHTRGPNDIKAAVDFMVSVVAGYLAEYETDYIRFMSRPNIHKLAPAHLERNWPRLGEAADDLILLRKLLHAAIIKINQYAEDGTVLDWEKPNTFMADHWSRYAKNRSLCPTCGFNMNYAFDDDCPKCPSPSGKTTFRLIGYEFARANNVSVAGSFNNWEQIPMEYAWGVRQWVCRVDLPQGTHTYKFIMDGKWITDPNNPVIVKDKEGNDNSVLIVNNRAT